MTRPPAGPERPIAIDALRERLRALGYLNAGVDRFVLAPATTEHGTTALAWLLSVRIGLLVAMLLGPAAAAGLAWRVPGLIAGPRDAIVVTLYLAVMFGLVATAAALGAALVVRALARRAGARTARRVAVAAAWVVGAACLGYLTLWWNATGSAWSAPGRSALAIAAAVAISLFLGHATALAGLALVAHERETLPAPILSWRAILAIGVLAFLGAGGVLALSARGERASPAPSFAVVPTGVRVVVVGIDGFDAGLYQKARQRAAAATPILQRLAARVDVTGAGGDPAAAWTTIATGVPAQKHRVSGLQARRVVGLKGSIDTQSGLVRALSGATDLLRLTRPAPVSGLERRYKMVWEVAAEKGLDAAVVNWWATWPASGTAALVLSDRAVLRLERGGEPSAEVSPAALYGPLRQRWPGIARRATVLGRVAGAGISDPRVADILIRSATLDAQQALLARDPLLGTPDLLAVYLPGLDIAQHELLRGGDARALSPSALADRVAALPAYYSFLESLIDETLLRDLPDNTVRMVVAHPGRIGDERGAAMAMSGHPARTAPAIESAVPATAIAPTILYLLGVPVSRELASPPWLDALDSEFVRRHPVRYVDTYGAYSPGAPPAEGAPLDKEMMERLRSLGYIR
ncbi:MAG TPA: alkaline phosphatase family protein [Vicinamibacterales bacterium]|nr:alkaline phosphatase family protein [Vicinamibacterales bacterium]